MAGASAAIRNRGSIAGETNDVEFPGANSPGTLRNLPDGVISSDSRAVEIEGQGISVGKCGDIAGTCDRRNSTIYTNATAEYLKISTFTGAMIDMGADNNGASISLEDCDKVGDVVSNAIFNSFDGTADNDSFTNFGLLNAGRGNGSAVSRQTGGLDGDVVSVVINNEVGSAFQGFDDANEDKTIGDVLRLSC